MSAARSEILGRVRRALGSAGTPEQRSGEYAAIPREYRATGTLSDAERLELFADRLRDYDATVHFCPEAEVARVVAQALTARGKRGLLIPAELPAEWLPEGFDFVRDAGLSYEALDSSEGVLTGCAVAIALTGTIVLRHSDEQGRRALSLVPDYHLCVVRAEQLVETVPEGIRRMATFGAAPLTTIAGPSATADIEMTRIKGVHGPRTLEVILVVSGVTPGSDLP